MKMARLAAGALLAAQLTAACSEAETAGVQPATRPGAVSLTVGLSGAGAAGDLGLSSRSATRGGADVNSTLTAGEQLWAYMPDASGPTGQSYTIADADGDTRATRPTSAPLVSDGNSGAYPIYAYWPYQLEGAPSVTENTTAWSVLANQQSDADYKRSDLLYAKGTVTAAGAAETAAGTAKLSFSHQMAKLILQPYAQGTVGKMTKLTVTSGYRTVALAGTAPLTLGEPSDALSAVSPLTVYDASGVDLPTSASTQYCLLLPPQLLQQGTLVRLETSLGIRVNYRLTAATRIESGQAYSMSLPVSALTMDVDIADWQRTNWSYGPTGTVAPAASLTFSFTKNDLTPRFTMLRVPGNATVGADYYLGQTEVTNRLWHAVMGWRPGLSTTPDLVDDSTNPKTGPTADGHFGAQQAGKGQRRNGDDYPVSYITYNEIQTFIAALNTQLSSQLPAGYQFALPTMAQWQWAAKDCNDASEETYSSNEYAWTSTQNGAVYLPNAWGTTHPVATLRATKMGFYDMGGNVQELTSTLMSANVHYEIGGGYLNSPDQCSVRNTGYTSGGDDYRKNDMGLRLALVRTSSLAAVKALAAAGADCQQYVGWLVTADGGIHPPHEAHNGTPSGVIAYIHDGTTYGATAPESGQSYRMLVMALEDAGELCQWCTQTAELCMGSAYANGATATGFGYCNGLAATGAYISSAHASHPAAVQISQWRTNHAALQPATASAWFIPSGGQMNMMLKALAQKAGTTPVALTYYSGNQTALMATTLNPVITAVGGAGFQPNFYWLTTENSDKTNMFYYHGGGNGGHGRTKTLTSYVRPVYLF